MLFILLKKMAASKNNFVNNSKELAAIDAAATWYQLLRSNLERSLLARVCTTIATWDIYSKL